MLTFTDRARDALETFHAAAARWNPDVRLRLARVGVELRPELAEAPEPGDDTIDVGSISVYVESGTDGVVDAGDHNVLTIAPG
jgi:Fe-S cluster assembly iron-binding protein IscA